MTDENPHRAGNTADLAVHLQQHKGEGHGRYIHGRSEVIQQGVLALEVMPANRQCRRDAQKDIQRRGQQTDLQAVGQTLHKVGGGAENVLIPFEREALGREHHHRRRRKGGNDDHHQRRDQKQHHQNRHDGTEDVYSFLTHSCRPPVSSYIRRWTAPPAPESAKSPPAGCS